LLTCPNVISLLPIQLKIMPSINPTSNPPPPQHQHQSAETL
jgi:hypothetical protein